MKVEYVNPFLEAFEMVIAKVLEVHPKIGTPYIKEKLNRCGEVVISLGVTGDVSGVIMLNISEDIAKLVASKMINGRKIEEFDEVAKSALSELANMVAVNSISFFSKGGFNVNITPPSLYIGKDMNFYNYLIKSICVPMKFDNISMELDLAISQQQLYNKVLNNY